MAGYKQWADGDILLPTDIDEFLMGQSNMRFSDSADRDGTLVSPVDGQRSFLEDTGLEYVYSNGDWAPTVQWTRKTAGDQDITSSTTLEDDDDNHFELSKGVFRVEAFLAAVGAAAGDIKVAWTFDGTLINSSRSCFGPALGTSGEDDTNMRATTTSLTTAVPYGLFTAAAIHEDLFLNISVAGTLTLQFAQNTSNGTATSLTVQSRAYATRLG